MARKLPPLWVLLLVNLIGFIVAAGVLTLGTVERGQLIVWLQAQFVVLLVLTLYGLWQHIFR
jgi:hypothetical protein